MQITIRLPVDAALALKHVATVERRRPADQAAIMLERALVRRTQKTREASVK